MLIKKISYEAPEASAKDILHTGLMCASTHNNIDDIQYDADELDFN
jgi:hypothetical protein